MQEVLARLESGELSHPELMQVSRTNTPPLVALPLQLPWKGTTPGNPRSCSAAVQHIVQHQTTRCLALSCSYPRNCSGWFCNCDCKAFIRILLHLSVVLRGPHSAASVVAHLSQGELV